MTSASEAKTSTSVDKLKTVKAVSKAPSMTPLCPEVICRSNPKTLCRNTYTPEHVKQGPALKTPELSFKVTSASLQGSLWEWKSGSCDQFHGYKFLEDPHAHSVCTYFCIRVFTLCFTCLLIKLEPHWPNIV